jgi:GT2 family glycosyltransferase
VSQVEHTGFGEGRLALGLVTHNSVADLERYFWGQLAVARELGIPLIVVDNCSRDGSADYVERIIGADPTVTVVRSESNCGYAAAANRVFNGAGRRDVLLLNADVELCEAAAVRALVESLAGNPRVGILAPRLLNPDGSTQSSARAFPNLLAMAGHASSARRLQIARHAASRYLLVPPLDQPSRVDWAIGAALLVRREAFETVGGFDERFFLYLEDTDFCLRCGLAGWETWYEPRIAFRHLHARASDPARGGMLRSSARRYHVASLVRFFARYPGLAVDGRGAPAPDR